MNNYFKNLRIWNPHSWLLSYFYFCKRKKFEIKIWSTVSTGEAGIITLVINYSSFICFLAKIMEI